MAKGKNMKRKQNKNQNHQSKSLVGFLFVGLIHDLLFVIRGAFKVFSWPVLAVSHWFAKEMKAHPDMWVLHSHRFWAVCLGVLLLFVSFAVEHYSNHPLWKCSLEVMKAVGACPLWEGVSAILAVIRK